MFVDLRLRARGRVHDSGRRPAGAPNLDKVEGDGRLAQAVPDGVAVAPTDEPAGKHRHVEGPQSARDVYALAARERDALRRPVSVAERQARDDEGPVHGGVDSYGQDHLQTPPLFPGTRLQVLPLYTTPSRRIPPHSLLPGARLPAFRPPGKGLRRALQWAPCVPCPAPRSPDETPARRRLARALWCRRLPDLRLTRDRNGEPNAPPTGPEHRRGGTELRVRAPGR